MRSWKGGHEKETPSLTRRHVVLAEKDEGMKTGGPRTSVQVCKSTEGKRRGEVVGFSIAVSWNLRECLRRVTHRGMINWGRREGGGRVERYLRGLSLMGEDHDGGD